MIHRSSLFPLVLALGLILATAPPAAGQLSNLDSLTISNLRTPSAPGFLILGIAPTAIERPQTPKALALGLLSSVKGGDDLIPQNYSVEVAPYWFKPRPALTFNEYFHPSIGQALKQTTSVSFATVPISQVDPTGGDGTQVGFGIRMTPVVGRPAKNLTALTDSLTALQQQVLLSTDPNILQTLGPQMQALALQIQQANTERRGFMLEFAGAIVLSFRDDNVEKSEVTRYGAWLTPAYRLDDPQVDFVGVARYIRDETPGTEAELLDFGGRLISNLGALSLSAEYVRRTVLETAQVGGVDVFDGTYRLNVNVDYQLGGGKFLFANLGRNFDPGSGSTDNTLIAQVGLNLGFGQPIFTTLTP